MSSHNTCFYGEIRKIIPELSSNSLLCFTGKPNCSLNRGSYMSAHVLYMSAHVLLNLFNKLGKKIRCEALPSILSVFPNKLNKFNNTGA